MLKFQEINQICNKLLQGIYLDDLLFSQPQFLDPKFGQYCLYFLELIIAHGLFLHLRDVNGHKSMYYTNHSKITEINIWKRIERFECAPDYNARLGLLNLKHTLFSQNHN